MKALSIEADRYNRRKAVSKMTMGLSLFDSVPNNNRKDPNGPLSLSRLGSIRSEINSAKQPRTRKSENAVIAEKSPKHISCNLPLLSMKDSAFLVELIRYGWFM